MFHLGLKKGDGLEATPPAIEPDTACLGLAGLLDCYPSSIIHQLYVCTIGTQRAGAQLVRVYN